MPPRMQGGGGGRERKNRSKQFNTLLHHCCICHTHIHTHARARARTHARTHRGCPNEVVYLTVCLSWLSALPTLCSTHCSPVSAILPNSRALDGYPPSVKTCQQPGQQLNKQFKEFFEVYRIGFRLKLPLVLVCSPECECE